MRNKFYIFCLAGLAVILASCREQKAESKPIEYQAQQAKATVYTTAKDSEWQLSLTSMPELEPAVQPTEGENSVFLNTNKQFQTYMGMGGAITDASAEVFAKLSKTKQQELLRAYFSDSGNAYRIIRTSIHSCDFSPSSYTYVDEGDITLQSFTIEHDLQFRIPMIKAAMETSGKDMTVYLSPWSPPAFMKSNGSMLKGGKLLPKYYPTWAMYFAKTIKAYEKEGIPIWGITIQNEPMAKQRWESCIYTAEEERDFLKYHLGPTMEKEGLGDKKIVVWDHNRDLLAHRAFSLYNDPEAARYAWGTGFHWYETWRGGKANYSTIDQVNDAYPDKKLLFTEGCNEAFDSAKYLYWPNAERYGDAIINDFNHGTVGWTDWNILLNHTGGPNHVGNFCFAPIHADTRYDSLIYTPSYFYLGHFSRFIQPGARRISSVCSLSFLQSTAFINPDGNVVAIIMNTGENMMEYTLMLNNSQSLKIIIPARAIQTVVM